MGTASLTLRLPATVKEQLDKLSEAAHRSKSYLAGEAIRQLLELEVWQIGEMQQALKEADANDFASDDEVNGIVTKYAG